MVTPIQAAAYFSILGGFPGEVIVVLGFFAALLILQRQRAALTYLLAILLSALTFNVMKFLIHRPRPVDALIAEPGYSFPSGHATMGFAAYVTALVLIWPIFTSRVARACAVIPVAVLVAVIGASRIVLGVHYVSDVIAGYAVALLIIPVAQELGKVTSLKDGAVIRRIEAAVVAGCAFAVAAIFSYLSLNK